MKNEAPLRTTHPRCPFAKSFNAPVERVYAAAVQAVGGTLKSSVKEAYTINFLAKLDSFTTWFGTAICRDQGNGKTVVTLSLQLSEASTQKLFLGKPRDKMAGIFWSNLETALNANSVADSTHVTAPSATSQSHDDLAIVTVKSAPDGADITVDGKFSGSAPSALRLAAGDHIIKVAMKGFRVWERTITVTAGGVITINAVLEQEQ